MSDTLTISRTFAAPRQLVFDAWTKPQYFSIWFGSDAVEVPLDSLVMDVRVGGELRAVMVLPDGNRINWAGQYTEVDPPARLAFTLTDEPDMPADQWGAPMTADFAEVEGGTEVTFRQPGIGDWSQEQIEGLKEGYKNFFDTLEKLLVDIA